jgi:Fic family protein
MNGRTFWEGFSFDYTIDTRSLFDSLIAVEAHRLAALNLILAPEWQVQLDRLNRVRAVYGTTALEGNPLSEAEVAHQMDLADQEGDTPKVSLTREQLQIRNAAKAQTWVKTRFAPGTLPVGLSDLLTMHKMITEHSDENHNVPGALRALSVQVGSPDMGGVHIGAPHDTLGELMEEFISFVNSRKLLSEHPVIRALLAHFFLVTIHPFGDGNGRVSRLLEAGILFQHDYNVHGFYGLSNFFYSNERDYKISLQQSRHIQHPFNLTPLVSFGVKGFITELEGINNFIKTKINRVMYRQMLVSTFNKRVSERRRMLNEREHQLLLYLLHETEPIDPFSQNPSRRIKFDDLLQSGYVKGAYSNVTRRTFIRELIRLHDLGFIKVDDENRRELIVEIDFAAIARYQIS